MSLSLICFIEFSQCPEHRRKKSRLSVLRRRPSTTRTTRSSTTPTATLPTCATSCPNPRRTCPSAPSCWQIFAACDDSQRSWLLLEDYFNKLNLARKDFSQDDWWGSMAKSSGDVRLEELALVFMKSGRSVPNELMPYANFTRFAQVEQAEKDYQLFKGLEEWMFPPSPSHLDAPRAALRVVGRLVEDTELPGLHKLGIEIHVIRPRTGDRVKTLDDMADLTMRAAHEQELFPSNDWSFIRWSSGVRHDYDTEAELIPLDGAELLKWLVQWGKSGRIDLEGEKKPIEFLGRIIEMEPHLEKAKSNLYFTHEVICPAGKPAPCPRCAFLPANRRWR